MVLPKSCSFRSNRVNCALPPSFIISLQDTDNDNEYMIGAVCDLHQNAIRTRIQALQSSSEIPHGKIKFDPVIILGTNCIKIPEEEYDNFR